MRHITHCSNMKERMLRFNGSMIFYLSKITNIAGEKSNFQQLIFYILRIVFWSIIVLYVLGIACSRF